MKDFLWSSGEDKVTPSFLPLTQWSNIYYCRRYLLLVVSPSCGTGIDRRALRLAASLATRLLIKIIIKGWSTSKAGDRVSFQETVGSMKDSLGNTLWAVQYKHKLYKAITPAAACFPFLLPHSQQFPQRFVRQLYCQIKMALKYAKTFFPGLER